MVNIKERYIWIAFIAVVIVGSLYLRYYYQAPVSITVSMSTAPGQLYPFQMARIPISISNTGGSTINNISFGVYNNGNITTTYKAYIPAGKQATVYYNFTPKTSGTYEISVVADPSRLYDISNRQSAQASIPVTVLQPEAAAPYSNFPANSVSQDFFNMSPEGYLITAFYFNNFSKYFYITGSIPVDSFIYPALDTFSSYKEIDQMAISHAYYSNYSLAAIWIKGYITPAAIDVAAQGKEINVTRQGNVSIMNFGNATTLCSYYSSGWTKMLISIGGKNCTAYSATTSNKFNYSSTYGMLKNSRTSLLNYSGYNMNLTFSGDIFANQNAIVFESLMKNGNFSNICYGNIYNISNDSYCMQTMQQGNITLEQLNRLAGAYNVSVWWLPIHANLTQKAANYAFNLSGSYSLPGTKDIFVSAYANRCIFTQSIGCVSPLFVSNATALRIQISLINGYNKTLTINRIGCTLVGNFTLSSIDSVVAPGKNTTVYMPCFNYGKEINSTIIPYGVPFKVELNYSYGAAANTTYGLVEVTR